MTQHNKKKRAASSNDWILWVLIGACVAISSLAYVAFKAKSGDALIGAVMWAVIAGVLCVVVWQIWTQLDRFKGKQPDDDPREEQINVPVIEPLIPIKQDSDKSDAVVAPTEEQLSMTEYLDDDSDIESVVFPANFPKELNTYQIKAVFIELAKAQILDKDFQPAGLKKVQKALLADAISTIFQVPTKWKVFEGFWNEKNLSQSLAQGASTGTQLDPNIVKAIANASRNRRVADLKRYSDWLSEHLPK